MKVSVKYPYGSEVLAHNVVPGIVTAVTIRGGYKSYEFSYINNDGNPASTICTEAELSINNTKPIGFSKESK